MTPIVVVVPMRLPSAANLREHHMARARRVKDQRKWVGLALRSVRPRLAVGGGLRCTLTRVGPRPLDSDNLDGAFKAVRDAVAEWMGVDDGDEGPDGFWEWKCEQRKGLYAVEIRLEQR